MRPVRSILATTAIAPILVFGCRSAPESAPPPPPRNPYLEAAIRTADWLEAVAIRADADGEGPDELRWPVEPGRSDATPAATGLDDSLYHGNPGVVLFFLEASRVLDAPRYLEIAKLGANGLARRLPTNEIHPEAVGLYDGVSGVGFALEETYRATGEESYRHAARRAVEILYLTAGDTGGGLAWNDATDLISGSAGIGFFLRYAERRHLHPDAAAMAERAARHLLALGESDRGGLRWRMDPTFPRYMPNYSHGTAGVAAFLAAVYADIDDRELLGAAEAGAAHLLALAETEGGGCSVHHHEPGGEDLRYLGWCHGPVGTARLFERLYQATGNPLWLEWVERCAVSILNSGIPEERTPGFWNNFGQCCGDAGVLEFLLDLHVTTGRRMYLDAAKQFGDSILDRAVEDGTGLRWPLAEHRVRPDETAAQSGYMQGAAGIGIALLHLGERVEREAGRHGPAKRLVEDRAPLHMPDAGHDAGRDAGHVARSDAEPRSP